MRVRFGLARVAHIQGDWEEGYLCWVDIMDKAKIYGWTGDLAELVICSSLSVVCQQLNYCSEHKQYARRGFTLRRTVKDQFWCRRLHQWPRDMFLVLNPKRPTWRNPWWEPNRKRATTTKSNSAQQFLPSSAKLRGSENHSHCKAQIKVILASKELQDFILPNQRPTPTSAATSDILLKAWITNDAKAKLVIMVHVAAEPAELINNLETAAEMRETLQN